MSKRDTLTHTQLIKYYYINIRTRSNTSMLITLVVWFVWFLHIPTIRTEALLIKTSQPPQRRKLSLFSRAMICHLEPSFDSCHVLAHAGEWDPGTGVLFKSILLGIHGPLRLSSSPIPDRSIYRPQRTLRRKPILLYNCSVETIRYMVEPSSLHPPWLEHAPRFLCPYSGQLHRNDAASGNSCGHRPEQGMQHVQHL